MRSVFALVFSVSLALLAGDVLAQPPAPKFGALAVDRTRGFFYGFAYDHPTRAEAERRALEEARKRGSDNAAIVLVWSGTGCGAYETVNERDGDAYGWGVAPTRQRAETIAGQEAARRANGRPTPNHAWACNSNDPAPFQILRNEPVGQSAGGGDIVFRPKRLAAAIRFSPDSKMLAVLGYGDGKVTLIDTRTGETIRILEGITGSPRDIAFSPDGSLLAGSDTTQLIIWNASTGARVGGQKNDRLLDELAFSADGRQIFAMGAQDSYEGPVQGWVHWIFNADGSTARKVTLLEPHTYAFYGAVYGPGTVVTFGDKPGSSLKFWDQGSGRLLASRSPYATVRGGGVSRDGRLIAATGDGVSVWDLSGQRLASLGGGTVYDAAFSPDGGRLATANYDKTVVVWDLSTKQPIVRMTGHTGWVTHVAYSPDGRLIASGGEDGAVRLWDAATGAAIKAPAKPQVAPSRAAPPPAQAATPKTAQPPKAAASTPPKAAPSEVPAAPKQDLADQERVKKLNDEFAARQAEAAAKDKAARQRYEADVAKAEEARRKYEREEVQRQATIKADQARYAQEQAKAAAAKAAYDAEVAKAAEARRKYEEGLAEYQRKFGGK